MRPLVPSRPRWLIACLPALALSACQGEPAAPQSDGERIVRSVLALLAADRSDLCVDRTTQGASLSSYRTMLAAPDAARASLGWMLPAPLRTPSPDDIRRIAIDDFRLPADAKSGPLSLEQRVRIDGAARRLAYAEQGPAVRIGGWVPAGMKTAWLPFRSASCVDLAMTTPVHDARFGFVTAAEGHWATTYALEARAGDWTPVARWSGWVY